MTIDEIRGIHILAIKTAEEGKKLLKDVEEWIEKHPETLESYLDDLTDDEKVTVYNAYAEDGNYERLYSMDMLDDAIGYELSPSEVLRKVDLKKFSLDDSNFWYDGYGDIVSGSVSDFLDANFSGRDVASWLERNGYAISREVDNVLFDWTVDNDDAEEMKDNLESRIEDLEDEESED